MKLPALFGSRAATVGVALLAAAGVTTGTVLLVGSSNASHTVVGFGDSVPAGYGLSVAATWPVSRSADRFANGGAQCSATPKSYPCVLAGLLHDDVGSSRNYAIQGASSSQVLDTELTAAERDLSLQAQRAVNVVTLTVGADDINFSGCLSEEFKALSDSCLAGDINNLKLSDQTASDIRGLESNLPQVLVRITKDFPNAGIYVTEYYQPLAPPVVSGGTPCRLYAIPALSAFLNNLGGTGVLAKVAAFKNYVGSLSSTESLFQRRFSVVATFLSDALNTAITRSVSSAPARTTVVPLASFGGHDMCSGDAWVYTLSTTGGIAGVDAHSLGPQCLHPYLGEGTSELNKSISLGRLGTLTFSTNCIPHPTPAGQARIADAIQRAPDPATPPIAVVPPVGPTVATTATTAPPLGCSPCNQTGPDGEVISISDLRVVNAVDAVDPSTQVPVLALKLTVKNSSGNLTFMIPGSDASALDQDHQTVDALTNDGVTTTADGATCAGYYFSYTWTPNETSELSKDICFALTSSTGTLHVIQVTILGALFDLGQIRNAPGNAHTNPRSAP